MPKDKHEINRKRDADGDDQFECDECGESFESEERLKRHTEREKRQKLRGSPIGDAILDYDRRRSRRY